LSAAVDLDDGAVYGQRRISADTALRLARFFGTSERFWINLQARYDLETEKDRLGDALDGSGRSAPQAERVIHTCCPWDRDAAAPARGTRGNRLLRVMALSAGVERAVERQQ
jgi:hypothetical protein